ncbi:DUF4304 domain-containing protein [Polymorphobacter arshaanensis]|uniref:DUF4304 domain-containing protein n=1 Tax=Glacieibacterium arshaanense TaxID=2511025 RepID=A0A4Y9EJP9_9SPHN|nr:DUF4304 domain-containing protein [Polymorphobacter arshaanensis]TFT99820.1 DUF4304 domain-containing protein [Polymorphobacter arshaanensis]
MSGPHDKLIANTAKQILGSLGFRQKGRSRTWIADHGWWLTVVEFQPSNWNKGCYLNVAVHFLWLDQGHITFDYGKRVSTFVEYESDKQFEPEVKHLALLAAQEARSLEGRFSSIGATANELDVHQAKLGLGSWATYHAGMALALCGRLDEAKAMFRLVQDARVHSAVARIQPYLNDHIAICRKAEELIARQRSSLNLSSKDECLLPSDIDR